LKPGGRFYMVHRPHRTADIVYELRNTGLEPKMLRFVHSYIGKPPVLVLVEAIRDGKPFLKVPTPLVIHKDGGEYTDEAYEIYYM